MYILSALEIITGRFGGTSVLKNAPGCLNNPEGGSKNKPSVRIFFCPQEVIYEN